MTRIKEQYGQTTNYRVCWHFIRMALPVFCLCLIFTACVDDNNECRSFPRRTIVFYMAGDNNLTNEISGKSEQLKATLVPVDCRLLVFQDTRESTPQLLEIARGYNGQNTLNIIRDYDECNTADASVFGKILQEVVTLYPSESYGLVFFSHASGWMPEKTYAKPGLRSVGIDGDSEMELPAFAGALPDNTFDFIVFETCHMAGIEVVWELKDKTSFVIASSAEIVSPGFAPVYSQALPCLFEQEPNLKRFVEIIAEDYRTRQGDYGSLTLSLIDTKKLDKITASIKECALPLPIDRSLQSFDRNGKDLFFDFYDAFSQSMASGQAANLQIVMEQCVVYKISSEHFMLSSGGFDIVSHSGLTTYVPQGQYPKLNEAYKKLKWYKEVLIYNTRKP